MQRVIALTLLALAVVSCSGKDGATGPQGPAGPSGPGSRIVYTSTEPIPTEAIFVVKVPEIDLDDMPLVSVYVAADPNQIWIELPVFTENGPDDGTVYYIADGEIWFRECAGFYYCIVIVT